MSMGRQIEFFEKVVDPADIVYTQNELAKTIVEFLNPAGKCLDPCKGDGAFYNYFPEGREYCELREGSDFLHYSGKVDWVIGNPPYSIFKDFLEKGFEIADNVSYLVPTNKIFQRQVIMEMINKYGGIKSMVVYGSGSLIGFPFGFSVGNFHFKKGYKGECKIVMGVKTLFGRTTMAT